MPDGSGSPLPAVAQPASDLLRRALAAVRGDGRPVTVDWDLEAFDVGPGEVVVGVVLSASRSVVFYAVRPEYVPQGVCAVVAEAVTRANTLLHTSAFELDMATGNLSVRAGFEIGDVTVTDEAFGGLVVNAVDEVERVYEQFGPPLDEVIAGHLTPAEAMARWVA